MYTPDAFRVEDRATLLAHAVANPFATVIFASEGDVEVSHLPLLVDATKGVLRGHIARENPLLSHITAGEEALAIFHGADGYVSPSVYIEQPSVPTWNYVVVHSRGRARPVDALGLRAILADTVARFDPTGWESDEEFLRSMLDRILGFEIAIERLEGKWKLSQNRSLQDQARVASWLDGRDDRSRAVAAIMRARLATGGA